MAYLAVGSVSSEAAAAAVQTSPLPHQPTSHSPPTPTIPSTNSTSTATPSNVPTPNNRSGRPRTSDSNNTMPSVSDPRPPQKLKLLVLANGEQDVALGKVLGIRFSNSLNVDVSVIADDCSPNMERRASACKNHRLEVDDPSDTQQREFVNLWSKNAAKQSEWANMLVLAPIDANTMAKMLSGITGNMILEILRGWDVSKKIIMIPGMTAAMWDNPMTRNQLYEIRTKWPWVRVMDPIIWHFDAKGPGKCFTGWDGFPELYATILNQAELMAIGNDVDDATSGELARRSLKTDKLLPPEIWSMIFKQAGDWETAVRLRVWTNLPKPEEWKTSSQFPRDNQHFPAYMRELELTILLDSSAEIVEKLSRAPSGLLHISSLCVKLIIKFGLVDILNYLEKNLKKVFWASFGATLIPTKASAAYGRPEVLEWWRTSPSFLKKDYNADCIDGASKSGFVNVLDWWHKSGLPLKYTDAALEQASSKGHILVLEWWKEASMHQGSYFVDADSSKIKHTSTTLRPNQQFSEATTLNTMTDTPPASAVIEHAPIRLKVGKSIIGAAQNGRVATVRWWDTSGIPYSHSESVAKIASAYGHVTVLEAWKELKGEKFAMSFDHQVLVGPTKNGFARVLEWWKKQATESSEAQESMGGQGGRLKVEYKTCDVEEALEDSVNQGGEGEDEVRKWWARNGLNLGVGTSEWMRIKTL